MDPTGSVPVDQQTVDMTQIGKPIDSTGVDKETIIKNYILKDNTNNTTFYQPALATATTTTPTAAATTTAATSTTTTAATTIATGTSTVTKKDEGLSTGAIIGIAVVATAVVGCGIYLIVSQTSAPTPGSY